MSMYRFMLGVTVSTSRARSKDGYLAACKAYAATEEQEEYGAYLFLTGYEYAHLARRYIPADVPPTDKHEWHRGFVLGWNACTFGLKGNEEPKLAFTFVDTAGWPLDM